MIDIEALADTPDSAPAEIALVFFDRDTRAFATRHFEPSPISPHSRHGSFQAVRNFSYSVFGRRR